jgi:hypothetical protein
MTTDNLEAIEERLKALPPEKLAVVYEFVSCLAEGCTKSALETMIASEAVLARDWNRPEEEEAWADL